MRNVRRAMKAWFGFGMISAVAGLVFFAYGDRDKDDLAVLAGPTKTACVGRFLIDVPANAQVNLRSGLVQGFEAPRRCESQDGFAARPHARDTGLSAKTNMLACSFMANTYDPDQAGVLPARLTQLAGRAENDVPSDPGLRVSGARTRTRREGERAIKGDAGEEVAIKSSELNFAPVFRFVWETPGSDDNVRIPHLSLELDTGMSPQAGGASVQSSPSEEAVLLLWNKVSSSIRLRPAGPGKVAETGSPPPPLGTLAEAGDRCPQSGWWLCNEACSGVNVLGGQRHYLCKGQEMPQALLLPRQTLWQRLRGLQSSHGVGTRRSRTPVDRRERDRSVPTLPLAPL